MFPKYRSIYEFKHTVPTTDSAIFDEASSSDDESDESQLFSCSIFQVNDRAEMPAENLSLAEKLDILGPPLDIPSKIF